MMRLSLMALCYWPLPILLILLNMLGDCGSSGEPEIRCPMTQTHLEVSAVLALGLFAAGLLVLRQQSQKCLTRNASIVGLGLAGLFAVAYYSVAGWIGLI